MAPIPSGIGRGVQGRRRVIAPDLAVFLLELALLAALATRRDRCRVSHTT
jgi:hypothetical protein